MTEPVLSPRQAGEGSRRRSELEKRVLSALTLAGLALFSAWYGGFVFAAFWGVAAIAVFREWLTVIGLTGKQLWAALAIGTAGLLASIALVIFQDIPTLFAFLPVIVSGLALALFFQKRDVAKFWYLIGPLYAASVVLGPMALRVRAPEGLLIIFWLFLVVWISDIGAFFVGRKLGGPKLWPSISPKKTWSGFFGGIFVGTLVPVLAVYLAKIWLGVEWLIGWQLFLLTLSTALVAECGDLFESAMKRRFGVKDTGNLIPGHGGVMDRLDSYTAAALYVSIITGLLAI